MTGRKIHNIIYMVGARCFRYDNALPKLSFTSFFSGYAGGWSRNELTIDDVADPSRLRLGTDDL
jgi:hypothetical protein